MTPMEKIDYAVQGLQHFTGKKEVTLSIRHDEVEELRKELAEEYGETDCMTISDNYKSVFFKRETEYFVFLEMFGITFNLWVV